MTDCKHCAFKDPTATVQRLTPIAQAEQARLAAARNISGPNPFSTFVGRTVLNPNLDQSSNFPANLFKGKKKVTPPGDEPVETTFQPQIGQPNIGSSAANWRRTEHPVAPKTNPLAPPAETPVNTSNIGPLIAELKAQRDKEKARREQDEYRIRCKAALKEQSLVTSIVAAVTKRIKDEEILKPDGSNL
jgi:hypothetical protein